MDTDDCPLMGAHGYCSQEMVHLLQGTIDILRKHLFIGWEGYTAGEFVWCDRPFYLVKQPQEKWACDFHDDAPPLSFQLQVAEVIF